MTNIPQLSFPLFCLVIIWTFISSSNMSMSLFFPIDEGLTDPARLSRSMALLGPRKTCKTSLAFGVAFKLLGEDVDANRQNTTIVMVRPEGLKIPPLHVHHMPLATLENQIAMRCQIQVFKSMDDLLVFSKNYHDLEQKTVPRAFILDDLHIMAERHYHQPGKLYDSQNYVEKIVANFMDLADFYSKKFDVPCYVIITANDNALADVGCCVNITRNLMTTTIHVEKIHADEDESDETEYLKAGDLVKYRMRDISNGFNAYFKIEDLEIFYERLTKMK